MKWTGVALTVGTVMLAATAGAAKSKAENGLLGIKLYDSGTRVISIYGTPDQIDAVNIGGGAAGSGSPFGGPGGGLGGPPGGGRGFGGPPGMGGKGGMGPGAASPGLDNGPFSFGNSLLAQGLPPGLSGSDAGGGGGGRPPSGAGMPPGMRGGPPGGFGGPPGMGGGSGAPRGNGGAAESATYTRWIYHRNGSQYGFVFDKFNHVVQIEAIGLQNSKVKTSRGIGFGSTFAQIIKNYQAPDGYEISGDNVLVKYLSKAKVAFRLSRLGDKQPQVVTGVVVAAAKG